MQHPNTKVIENCSRDIESTTCRFPTIYELPEIHTSLLLASVTKTCKLDTALKHNVLVPMERYES